MTDEDAFLLALRSAPGDDTLRLVYADWLEERGYSRSEYLRVTYEAAGLLRRGLPWNHFRARLDSACEVAPSEWRMQTGPHFDVVLESFPRDKKIAVICILRELEPLGLAEAKTLIEAAPVVVKRCLLLEEADRFAKQLAFGLMTAREPLTKEQPYCQVSIKETESLPS
jgi:uncharacterized protein (TIGR02996 family)